MEIEIRPRVRRAAQRWKKIHQQKKKSIKHEECGWNYNHFLFGKRKKNYFRLKSGDFNFPTNFFFFCSVASATKYMCDVVFIFNLFQLVFRELLWLFGRFILSWQRPTLESINRQIWFCRVDTFNVSHIHTQQMLANCLTYRNIMMNAFFCCLSLFSCTYESYKPIRKTPECK